MNPRISHVVTASPAGQAPLRLVRTVREAAAALTLSRAQIYRMLGSGAIQSYKEGKRRLVPIAALEAYVQRQLAAAEAVAEGSGAA